MVGRDANGRLDFASKGFCRSQATRSAAKRRIAVCRLRKRNPLPRREVFDISDIRESEASPRRLQTCRGLRNTQYSVTIRTTSRTFISTSRARLLCASRKNCGLPLGKRRTQTRTRRCSDRCEQGSPWRRSQTAPVVSAPGYSLTRSTGALNGLNNGCTNSRWPYEKPQTPTSATTHVYSRSG